MLGKKFLKRSLNQEFDIFFSFLSNSLYIKNGYVWDKCSLPKNLFLVMHTREALGNDSGRSFCLKQFQVKEWFWKIFWQLLFYNKVNTLGFFAELELIGLGFRLRKITVSVYRFFWGHANYVYLFVPRNVFVEYSADERFVFFFSISSTAVFSLVSYLMLLKKLSSYRVTGFVRPGCIIRLNSGKQR